MRYLLPVFAVLLLLAACGGGGGRSTATDSPEPAPDNKSNATDWSVQYMQLGQARQLLTSLGLAGTSLSPEAYQCIQMGCPDEAPGDDSWGCLSVLPTGDPANAESLYPDDPPQWYSVAWRGALRETYSAPPEPVVSKPTSRLLQRKDIACGAQFTLETTAGDATRLLQQAGLLGPWQFQGGPAPTCAPGANCPIPGIAEGAKGCLEISVFDQPGGAHQGEPHVTAYVGFGGSGGEQYPDGLHLNYSLNRPVSEIEAAVATLDDRGCDPASAPEPDPYDSVPYTDSIQPTYWNLESASGSTLVLQVAAGGGCDKFERIDVAETGKAVTINAFIRHSSPGPNSACTLELKWHETTVELRKPLGERELLGCAPQEIWYIDHEVNCAEPGHGKLTQPREGTRLLDS